MASSGAGGVSAHFCRRIWLYLAAVWLSTFAWAEYRGFHAQCHRTLSQEIVRTARGNKLAASLFGLFAVWFTCHLWTLKPLPARERI